MTTSYPIAGDNTVEAVHYTAPSQGVNEARVWINRTQYFEGVPNEAGNFWLGGYQICEKWLKNRQGSQLTYEELIHYQRIVSAIADITYLIAEIDAVIDKHRLKNFKTIRDDE